MSESNDTFDYVQILRYLFFEYAAENGITSDELAGVRMTDFVKWVKKNRIPFKQEDKDLFQERLGASQELIIDTEKALKDPFKAFVLLSRVKYVLGLAARPVPKNPPVNVSIELSLQWPDRTNICRIHASPTIISEGITDGQLCTLVSVLSEELVKLVGVEGIDKMYEEAHKFPVQHFYQENKNDFATTAREERRDPEAETRAE